MESEKGSEKCSERVKITEGRDRGTGGFYLYSIYILHLQQRQHLPIRNSGYQLCEMFSYKCMMHTLSSTSMMSSV